MRRVLCVVPTRNRVAGLERCLHSLDAATSGIDARAWICDASDRPIGEPPDMRLLTRVWREDPPRGFGPGLNGCIAHAYHAERALGWDPEYVTWANDDATYEPGWGEALAATIAQYPHAAMYALPYLTPHEPEGWHINLYPRPTLPYANFGVVPLETFWRVGGFDERVRLYGGDNALAFRLYRTGRGIVPVPHGCIVHHFDYDPQRAANQHIPRADWSRVQPEYFRELAQYEVAQNSVPPEAWSEFEEGPMRSLVLREAVRTRYADRYGFSIDEQAGERVGA